MSIDYLKRILTAKVYDVADETPLDPADILSTRLSNRVLLKREDMQPVFSFKLRGAYNRRPGSWRAASSPPRPATTPRAWRWRRAASAAAR